MNNYIKNPIKNKIGLTAFLIMLIPSLIGLGLAYVGNTYYPCHTGSGTSQGFFGCDNKEGDIFMWIRAIAAWSLLFFSPIAILTAIVALVKGSGPKLAYAALALAAIFIIFFAPFH